ncbi:hypothetical protein CNYM01_03949 [Colletotrichum nymphaeae SA-01]|uniref:Uncharacterized protein n=1 Tax=Colletotrichum nymphaeae SA-01 TaxID=1460502 RepID=A0A135T2J4_9PEZI|nr:hypothetical protein CNYM01_03949 [Colletotrichum nymphaeae SA-01]
MCVSSHRQSSRPVMTRVAFSTVHIRPSTLGILENTPGENPQGRKEAIPAKVLRRTDTCAQVRNVPLCGAPSWWPAKQHGQHLNGLKPSPAAAGCEETSLAACLLAGSR